MKNSVGGRRVGRGVLSREALGRLFGFCFTYARTPSPLVEDSLVTMITVSMHAAFLP